MILLARILGWAKLVVEWFNRPWAWLHDGRFRLGSTVTRARQYVKTIRTAPAASSPLSEFSWGLMLVGVTIARSGYIAR
jgi:hypothetical protein